MCISLLSGFGLRVLTRVQASLLRVVQIVSSLQAMVELLLVISFVARSLSLFWCQLRSLPSFITPWLSMFKPVAYTDVIKNKSTHLLLSSSPSPQGASSSLSLKCLLFGVVLSSSTNVFTMFHLCNHESVCPCIIVNTLLNCPSNCKLLTVYNFQSRNNCSPQIH